LEELATGRNDPDVVVEESTNMKKTLPKQGIRFGREAAGTYWPSPSRTSN